jgi:hypothetical protein
MKTHENTFSNCHNKSVVAIGDAVAVASKSEESAGVNSAHLGILVAHPSLLAQRNRFEIHSAEGIWQRTRKK